jgi:hypothetical protein
MTLIRKNYVLEENLFQRRWVHHKSQGNWQAFFFIFNDLYVFHVGWDGAGGIATRHALDSPQIEFRWGRDFPQPSRPVLEPIQSFVKWVPGLFFPGVKQRGRGLFYPTTTIAEADERVELLFYSPSRPSWAALG